MSDHSLIVAEFFRIELGILVTRTSKIFKYCEGGFTASKVDIEWVNEELHICRADVLVDPLDEGAVKIIVPSLKAWSIFQEDLDRLDFWNWHKEYVDDHIFDGVQIEIDKQFTHPKKVFCSNKVPKNVWNLRIRWRRC